MPLLTTTPLSDAFNQIRTGESWADFSSWPGINADDQLNLGKAAEDPEVEGREKGCLRDSGSRYVRRPALNFALGSFAGRTILPLLTEMCYNSVSS